MKKRLRLIGALLVLALVLLGVGLWLRSFIDDQPKVPEDPGIPEVEDLPDPDEVE